MTINLKTNVGNVRELVDKNLVNFVLKDNLLKYYEIKVGKEIRFYSDDERSLFTFYVDKIEKHKETSLISCSKVSYVYMKTANNCQGVLPIFLMEDKIKTTRDITKAFRSYDEYGEEIEGWCRFDIKWAIYLSNQFYNTKRPQLPKKLRLEVYNKFDGHCAYCGKKITFSELQVDHINCDESKPRENTINNLYPSCADCNLFKSNSSNIEVFRKNIINDAFRISKNGTRKCNWLSDRITKAYHCDKNFKFYFEKKNEGETYEK